MIHKLADVHPNAQLGKNVKIGPFAHIAGDVVIGDDTEILPNAVIFDGARIGKGCRVFPGAVVSAIPQDLKFAGEVTTVEIGDHTTIRECVTINRGTVDRHKTVVGNHCLIMAYTHLGHDVAVGNHCILANSASIAGHVTIEDYAILEGIVAVQQFITIGAHSFVAGGSLVRKDIPPFVKAAREPISFVGVNSIGLRRRGFREELVKQIEDIYRLIYVQNTNMSKALAMVEETIAPSEERDAIVSFIKNSPKGVMRG